MDFSPNKASCDWSLLNSSISDPSSEDLHAALTHFFIHSSPEHPDAWLFCGTDDGPLFTLTVINVRRKWNGRKECDMWYIEYAAQDMDVVTEKKHLGTYSRAAALDLWQTFISVHLGT